MFRNLIGNLIIHERIETTEAKAKELRRVAERALSIALRLGDQLTQDVGKLSDATREQVLAKRTHAQRLVRTIVPAMKLTQTKSASESQVVDPVFKLFHELAPRYLERVKNKKGGGYTRIIKKGARRGDGAEMAFIEFVK